MALAHSSTIAKADIALRHLENPDLCAADATAAVAGGYSQCCLT